MTSLNPLHTIEKQIGEILALHQGMSERRRARTLELLDQGRHPDPETRLERLSAPALGRAAPARDDRHGARQRARPADRRRADDGARRDRPGADPRSCSRTCSAPRHGHAVHHPRPRHRAQHRRPGLRDAAGQDRRDRAPPGASSPPAAPLHPMLLAAEPKGEPRRPPRRAPTSCSRRDLKVWFPIKRGCCAARSATSRRWTAST
jgi:microcin C transport system ATP-binding protein